MHPKGSGMGWEERSDCFTSLAVLHMYIFPLGKEIVQPQQSLTNIIINPKPRGPQDE